MFGKSRTEEPAKAGTCARDRRALQQLALNVHVKLSDLFGKDQRSIFFFIFFLLLVIIYLFLPKQSVYRYVQSNIKYYNGDMKFKTQKDSIEVLPINKQQSYRYWRIHFLIEFIDGETHF